MMTFQCEDQVSRVHVTYSIGTAYQECHQQIPGPRRTGQAGNFPVPAGPRVSTLLLREQVAQNKPFTLSSITVLFRSEVKWVPQFACTSTTKQEH